MQLRTDTAIRNFRLAVTINKSFRPESLVNLSLVRVVRVVLNQL